MSRYNYYLELKKKTNEIYYKYNLSEHIEYVYKTKPNYLLECITKEKLYNLVLNVANSVIYDYKYKFTEDEITFITNFHIDRIHSYIIKSIEYDICKMMSMKKFKYDKKD